ncbi:MAG: acyltransferase family protein [Methylophilus sp.]|nr:acyltransferase family protein [Methylophilus sp.]
MPTYKLSNEKSDLFNFLRWSCALLVVCNHIDMYMSSFSLVNAKSSLFGYIGMHGHSAVMVFFILSGYLVAYACEKNCMTKASYKFEDYFLDRWSRIYSVLLMAIAITAIIDIAGSTFSPIYDNPQLIPQDKYIVRLLVNVFSLQGIQGHRIQFGSNPALWSIGYEFIYYMIFGLFYFRKTLFKQRWLCYVLIVMILIISGWSIAIYSLIWLMGVFAYYINKLNYMSFKANSWAILAGIGVLNHLISYNGITNNTIVNDLIFGFFVALLVCLNTKGFIGISARSTKFNSFFAEFSYSVYAFHMPFVFLLCSILLYAHVETELIKYAGFLILVLTLLIAKLLSLVSENKRYFYRSTAKQVLALVHSK